MDDYLSKPVETRALRSILERWLPSPRSLESAPVAETSGPGLVVDLARLEATFGRENLAELIELFSQDAGSEVKRLGLAVSERDLSAVRRHSHGLKGLSASIFAGRMVEAYDRLHQACQEEDWPAIEKASQVLTREFEGLMTVLR